MARLPPRLRFFWPYAKQVYTVLSGAVGLVAMLVGRVVTLPTPRSVAATLDQVRADPGVRYREVAPAHTVQRSQPDGDPPGMATFAAQRTARLDPQYVLELPRGRVLGPSRALISAGGALLNPVVQYFGTGAGRQNPAFLAWRAGAPREVAGVLGVLATRGDGNYYHFLHDVLARLSVLERCPEVARPQTWYLPQTTRFQRELAGLMGLSADAVLDADRAPHVRAEVVVVPSVPDLHLNHPEWATRFLRERLRPAGTGLVAGRRIYVTRGRAPHNRIVVNEAEVLDALAPLGFTVLDPGACSVAEQIRAFAEAEVIVAPHGAALANLTFASPRASVVELFAPDFVQGCYWKLSTTVAGLRYRYLLGSGRVGPGRAQRGVSSDIRIDVASLYRTVERFADASR